MKRLFTGLICAGVLFSLNAPEANAAKEKSPVKTKKTVATDDLRTRDVTLVGVITMDYRDKENKTCILKEKGGGDWWLPASSVKYIDYEGLDVKVLCVRKGPDILSVKNFEPVDKAAFKAKQDYMKEIAAKDAEEKKAAAKATEAQRAAAKAAAKVAAMKAPEEKKSVAGVDEKGADDKVGESKKTMEPDK